MADQTAALDATARPETSRLSADRGAGRACRHRHARHQHPATVAAQMAVSLKVTSAAVTSAITSFSAVFAVGQLAVGPISDLYGRRCPVLIGFAVFFAGSIWCGLAADLPSLLVGRVIQAAGALRHVGAVARVARDMFSELHWRARWR